tara:strand:+ start:595 stop:813 length:219 start_codon:yes stop_codon:yes gene_type:complete
MLVVLFSSNAFAKTGPIESFFEGLFAIAFLGFIFYIVYKIYSNSIIGMSLKLKKHKLKKELEELNKDKKNNE